MFVSDPALPPHFMPPYMLKLFLQLHRPRAKSIAHCELMKTVLTGVFMKPTIGIVAIQHE
jgi:hypothetical protein